IIIGQFYKDFDFEHLKYTTEIEMIIASDLTDREKNIVYNVIPLENEANTWAILFIEENQDIIQEYEKIVIPLVKNIFEALS
ncbi:hypothetical protein DRO61_09640, partial [Candidatus Bathyarchaeota archaeon]